MNDIAVQPECSWPATLNLGYIRTPRKTILARRNRRGPLAVQRTLYPEGDACHTYLLHPPGGVAGGDELDITVDVATGASALITTPGATKFYRSIGPRSSLNQALRVDGGCLEWLPQENILFPGAQVEMQTHISLTGDARLAAWEITCLGRPVIDERFDRGYLHSRLHIKRDDRPVLLDVLKIDGEHDLDSTTGLRGQPVSGTFVTTVDEGYQLEQLRDMRDNGINNEIGLTIVDGLLVARYLGNSTERARKLFARIWQMTRPQVCSRPACTPRIWNT